MTAFQYYFDIRFIPQEFDSYFSQSLISKPVEYKTIKPIVLKATKYVPQIMEASTVEFKKTKISNNNKKKRK